MYSISTLFPEISYSLLRTLNFVHRNHSIYFFSKKSFTIHSTHYFSPRTGMNSFILSLRISLEFPNVSSWGMNSTLIVTYPMDRWRNSKYFRSKFQRSNFKPEIWSNKLGTRMTIKMTSSIRFLLMSLNTNKFTYSWSWLQLFPFKSSCLGKIQLLYPVKSIFLVTFSFPG
jgi:hypothetical protein